MLNFRSSQGIGTACAGLLVFANAAPANINFVNTGGGGGDRVDLTGIGVQRGAVGYNYTYADLITPTLTAANIPGPGTTGVLLYADPLDTNRDQALSDAHLNTGFLDTGEGTGSFTAPGDKFIALSFPEPVVNSAGPDLLVFGFGFEFDFGVSSTSSSYISFDGTTVHHLERAADFALATIDPVPMYAFSGGITTPAELNSKSPSNVGFLGNPPTALLRPVIHELDLSDYGIAANASINALYVQDDATDDRDLYPTLVAGLRPVPEPTSGALAVLAAAGLIRRRRRCPVE
ncbi:MAG: PEP-CTERM sorting domain-containing protein [Phycisphaerales bacterium]|nr:PEP-CTERM sorting domain-containing protein [Phycisphaerales bacterium]